MPEVRLREKLRGGRNNVRVDDEMQDFIEEILNENCLLQYTFPGQPRASATATCQTRDP